MTWHGRIESPTMICPFRKFHPAPIHIVRQNRHIPVARTALAGRLLMKE
jgi:hypothetical protein